MHCERTLIMRTAWKFIEMVACLCTGVFLLHIKPDPTHLEVGMGWFLLVSGLVILFSLHEQIFGKEARQ